MSTSGEKLNRHELAQTWIAQLKTILHRKWSLNKDESQFGKRCEEVSKLLKQAEDHAFYKTNDFQGKKKSLAERFRIDIESLRSQFTAALERGKRISEQPLKTEEKQKQLVVVSEDIKVVREKLATCIKQADEDLKTEPQAERMQVKSSELKGIWKKAYKSFTSLAEKKHDLIGKLDQKKIVGEAGQRAFKSAKTLLDDCKKRAADLVGDPLKITRTTPELIKQEEKLLAGIDFWLEQATYEPNSDKRGSGVNDKAYAQWIKILNAAERARDQLELMPGAEVFYRQLVNKIASAEKRIKPNVEEGKKSLLSGYPEAISELQDFQLIVNKATLSYQNAMNEGLPEDINQLLQRAKEGAFEYLKVGPASRQQTLLDEINRSAEQWQLAIADSREQTEPCRQQAKELAERIEREVKQMQESKQAAIDASNRFCKLIDTLTEADVAESLYAVYLRVGKQYSVQRPVESKVRKYFEPTSKAWPQIARSLNDACSGLEYIEKFQLESARKWTALQKEMRGFKKWAGALGFVPALRSDTGFLLSLVGDIEQLFKSTKDPVRCVELADKHDCLERLKKMRQLALLEVDREDIENDELGKLLSEATNTLREQVEFHRNQVTLEIDEIYRQLNGLEAQFEDIEPPSDPLKHPLRNELTMIKETWERAIGGLKSKDVDQPLELATNSALKACENLRNKILVAKKDVKKYQEENFKAPQENQNDPTEKVRKLIAQAKSFGLETQEQENLLVTKPYDANEEKIVEQYHLAQKALKEAIENGEKKHLENKNNLESKIGSITNFLKQQSNWKFGDFRGFRDEIKTQKKDLAAMLESGDPQLIELASGMADQLCEKLTEVTPGKGDKDAEAKYKRVVAIYQALSRELGGHAKKVPHKLPETYGRISKALIAAIAKSEKSSPKDAEKLFVDFWSKPYKDADDIKVEKAVKLQGKLLEEKGDTWVVRSDVKSAADSKIGLHVDQAVLLAQQHKQLNEMFKETVKEIEAEWSGSLKPKAPKGLKKTIKAGDKDCEYFENWFKARLKEADQARHGEDGIFRAVPILAEVKKRLKAIGNPEHNAQPLDVLKQFNEADKKNFELLCNLARQFEARVKSLKEVTLKEAGEFVEGLGENGDKNLVTSLLKSIEAAEKLVEPYLLNLSKVPHQYGLLADKAPNMATATSNFNTADAMLDDVVGTANRLMSIGNSTNVTITDDLLEVERTWFDGVAAFKRAVKETLQRFDGIDFKKEATETQTAIATARGLIDGIEAMFEETAFAIPFEKLRKEELKGLKKKMQNKEERKKEVQVKLAAREEALRTMRDLRSRLSNHPVIKTLADVKTNPVSGQSMIEALAVVNVALKRIEIQSLIGVPS